MKTIYEGARVLGPQLMNKLWLARNMAEQRAAMGSNPAAWRWGKEMLRPAYDRSPQFLQKFASNLVKTPGWEKGLAATGTAGIGLANQSEEGPLRAYGRPAAQFGGGILGTALGGATGFFADSPFLPVADFALATAGGGAGWEAGGRLFDKLVPPKGVNNSNAINTGMANIPVGTKDYELQERLRQGAYIPPGMTTSAGIPVKGQPGGSFQDTRPVVGGGTVHSRTGGLGKYTDRSIGIPGTKFQIPLGDISPTIDIPKNQALQGGGLSDIRTLGELDQLQGSSAFYQRGGGARQIALRRLELGQQLENEANLEAQMLQEAMSPAEIQARDQWLDATANSPAAQSGAFSNDQRWQTHLGDQQWQRGHGRPFTHGDFMPAASVGGNVPTPVGGSWTPPPGMFG